MLFMAAEVIQDGIKLSGAEEDFRNCMKAMKPLHTFTNGKKRHFRMHTQRNARIFSKK